MHQPLSQLHVLLQTKLKLLVSCVTSQHFVVDGIKTLELPLGVLMHPLAIKIKPTDYSLESYDNFEE